MIDNRSPKTKLAPVSLNLKKLTEITLQEIGSLRIARSSDSVKVRHAGIGTTVRACCGVDQNEIAAALPIFEETRPLECAHSLLGGDRRQSRHLCGAGWNGNRNRNPALKG